MMLFIVITVTTPHVMVFSLLTSVYEVAFFLQVC